MAVEQSRREPRCALRSMARQCRPMFRKAPACILLVTGSLNCVEWSLLPPVTAEMAAQAEQLQGRFQGDPSFEYTYTETKEDAERLSEDGKEVNTSKFRFSWLPLCAAHRAGGGSPLFATSSLGPCSDRVCSSPSPSGTQLRLCSGKGSSA